MVTSTNESVLELLRHFRDEDGRVGILLSELNTLSTRVKTADLGSDPRILSEQARRGASNVSSEANKKDELGYGKGAHAGARGGVASSIKVEDSDIPLPPSTLSSLLPSPPGGHEWEALQAAVNDTVGVFKAPNAKMGWKKWALTKSHSGLLLSLFWWTVAVVFCPDHRNSRPVQDFAFSHFCQHYVRLVMRLKGQSRDQYQQVWILMMSQATCYLLADVYPRSAHKFDENLEALVVKQLRLWTAGVLPADLHPSIHADAHDFSPAAYVALNPVPENSSFEEKKERGDGDLDTDDGEGDGGSVISGGGAGQGRSEPSPVRQARSAPAELRLGQITGHSFLTNKNSPVMQAVLKSHKLPYNLPVLKGLLKDTLGKKQAFLRRPLDEDTEAMSYKTIAATCTTAATEAVSAYTAAKQQARASSLACQKQSIRTREEITQRQREMLESQPLKVKDTSDKLSGWLQSDLNRMLAGFGRGGGGGAGGGGYSSSFVTGKGSMAGGGVMAGQSAGTDAHGVVKNSGLTSHPSRLMAPMARLRRIEGNIETALSPSRHNSSDIAARLQAVFVKRQAALEADWRPMAAFPVGSKDERRHRLVKNVLTTVDMKTYNS